MSILIAMIVGVLVGAGIGMILPKGADLFFMNIVSGLVGSLSGLGAYYFMFTDLQSTSLFNPVSILFSMVGAAIATLIFNSLNMVVSNGNDG